MNGRVDEERRALVDIRVGRSEVDRLSTISVWIDTAFNGFFVFPNQLIDQLGLQQEAATEAILADGNLVTLESYICFVDWFGQIIRAQVIANDGNLLLLGTELLDNYRLTVNYRDRTVSLD